MGAAAAHDHLLLDGSFECGDLEQFRGKEALDSEITVVGDPVRAGSRAAGEEAGGVLADCEGQGGKGATYADVAPR